MRKSIYLKTLMAFVIMLFAASLHAQYQFPACWAPYDPTQPHYVGGAQVSLDGMNYQAKYWTAAAPPDQSWSAMGACGDGGLGPDWDGPQRLIGYLPYWVPDYDLSAFDPTVVTHVNIAFNLFQRNNDNYLSADFASIAWGEFHKRKVDSLLFDLNILNKCKAAGTKVSVAIGGATDYAFLWLMTQYYNNDAKLEEIANFIVNYVNTTGIDGVDLDLECWWADPAIQGTAEQGGVIRGDKWGGVDQGPHVACVGLTRLCQKLRAKMPNKLITAAVFGTSWYGNNYDDEMVQYLDWLGLMTYDFTGSWDASPKGPHSSLYKVPLGTYPGQSADQPIYSVQDALEYWMGMAEPAWNHDGGFNVPKAKLAAGVPIYGYDFGTMKPDPGNGYLFTKYRDIVAEFPNAATSYDPLFPAGFGGHVSGNGKDIYYNTPKLVAEKVKYSDAYGHQGVIIWELTQDVDYNSPSSLLRALNEAIPNPGNKPPVASLTAPSTGDQIVINTPFDITADATDSDGVVTKVDFYDGTALIGTATQAPYTISYSTGILGPHAIKAIATDDSNATGESNIANIEIVNQILYPPTIEITSPLPGAQFTEIATIPITVAYADQDGSVTSVTVYADDVQIGTITPPATSFTWTNVTAGNKVLKAVAVDNDNQEGVSPEVPIVVLPDNPQAPVVNITNPLNNAEIIENTVVTITADASDADGSVTQVEFFVDDASIGVDATAPYSVNWTATPQGLRTIKAVATDNTSLTGLDQITVTVTPDIPCDYEEWDPSMVYNGGEYVCRNGRLYRAKWWTQGDDPALSGEWGVWEDVGPCPCDPINIPPVVSTTSPTPGQNFPAVGPIELCADASDPDGSVAQVEFFINGVSVGVVTVPPYCVTYTPPADGSYAVAATATDDLGATTTVEQSFSVGTTPNEPPLVSISSPANGASLVGLGTIDICADASDTDGSIVSVEIFVDNASIGTVTTAPYCIAFTPPAVGTYTIHAVATDDDAASTTSASTTVTFLADHPLCDYPIYAPGSNIQTGDTVQYNGKLYVCKVGGWCSSSAGWAYAPGEGMYWNDCWEYIGDCNSAKTATDAIAVNVVGVYPNPFEAELEFGLLLAEDSDVQIRIYSIQGALVDILVDQKFNSGAHALTFNAAEYESGMYIYQVSINGEISTGKLNKR